MKKYIIITLFLISLLCSCNKEFLQLNPNTSVTSEVFYKTESHFELALVGTYSQLRGIISAGHYMDEMRADNSFFRYYAPDRGPANWVEDIIQWTDQSQTTVVNNRYYSDFQGISRANTIISRIVDADISQEAKNRILGETLFLRAFFYFDLVTHYGGVPLYLKEVTDEASTYEPKVEVDVVYNQIITDLVQAIPTLPIVDKFPQSGRASKGAAKMLLAKAYMSMPKRDYPKAEVELRDLLKMNYSLNENYIDNFRPTSKNSKESIFEIQYKEGNDGEQNNFVYSMLPKTSNTAVATGIVVNNMMGGWNVPNQSFIDTYEAEDKRLPVSIKVLEGTLNGGSEYTDPVTYLAIKEVGSYTPKAGLVYYPFVSKYLHGPYSIPNSTGQNWPVFRYADALLLLAENLVAQGKPDDALPFINQVRKRAGLSALASVTKDNVLLERRHELAFENHRWTDLIRNGKAIEVMTAYGAVMKQKYSFLPATAFKVEERRLIYPIPFRETQINPNLVQNPGY